MIFRQLPDAQPSIDERTINTKPNTEARHSHYLVDIDNDSVFIWRVILLSTSAVLKRFTAWSERRKTLALLRNLPVLRQISQ